MRMLRLVVWIAPLALALAAAACKSPPHDPDPSAQPRVDALLVRARTKDTLSRFVGAPPALCIASSPGSELCEWRAGDRQSGWSAMAAAIGSDDRLNLICELPTSGEPRATSSCSIHPRRSNRYSWKVPSSASSRGSAGRSEPPDEVRRRHRETAARWIDEAVTIADLSRVVGALPDDCAPWDEGHRVCTWHTTSHTFGHGTLVVWIGAAKRHKIRLRCVLPNDDTPRETGSCYAEVGT